MKIKFWGVRGSIPTPVGSDNIKEKLINVLNLAGSKGVDCKDSQQINSFVDTLPLSLQGTYGGNTSCVQVVTEQGGQIILDCGSGLRNLGIELMKGPAAIGNEKIDIFLSHFHWDHIQGWPFFTPLFIKGNKVNIYSGLPNVKEVFYKQQDKPFFPIPLSFMSSDMTFNHFSKDLEPLIISGAEVTSLELYHPGGCYAYRIKEKGKTFVYATDTEFSSEGTHIVEKCIDFMKDADLVVMDAQYTFMESQQKLDWGHSAANTAIDIAGEAGVKNLILFHHEPTYNDFKIDSIHEEANMYSEAVCSGIESIDVAYEGLEIEL